MLACIVLRDHLDSVARSALAASIVAHALAQLAYYKAPGYVAFVDTLPLTASQKIQQSWAVVMLVTKRYMRACQDLEFLSRGANSKAV